MKDLFLSECRRFRTLALVAAAAHLLLQLLAARMTEPLQLRFHEQMIFLIASALCGAAFAVVQFQTHRQPSRWLWLLHRPLPRSRIFGALSLASLAAAAFAPFYQVLIWEADAYALAIAAMSLLLVWRHRGNIEKLLAGTESKLGQKAAPAAAPHAATHHSKGHPR